MSPKEDAFYVVHRYLHNVRRNPEDAWYFKQINMHIMVDRYLERDGLWPWFWNIIVGW